MDQDPELNVPDVIDVQLAFEHWRKHRTRREHTPVHLRKLAVQLLESNSCGRVCKALAINSATLKQWVDEPDQRRENSLTNGFIALAPSSTPIPKPELTQEPHRSESDSITLNITLPNGVELTAEHRCSFTQLLNTLSQMDIRP